MRRRAILLVVAAELALLLFARATSGLAHLHAIEQISQPTISTAPAACREAVAATDDFWPLPTLLNLARGVPMASVNAWAQLPDLIEAARTACPAVDILASLAPWPRLSIEDGALADLLDEARRQPAALGRARADMTRSWQLVQSVDADALAHAPRLERLARLLSGVRTERTSVEALLQLSAAGRLEELLGGRGARAVVLAIGDGQAHAVLHEGYVVSIAAGPPPVSAVATFTLERAASTDVLDAFPRLRLWPGAAESETAREMLRELTRTPLEDTTRVLSAFRRATDRGLAWASFADPALQTVAADHGWAQRE